MTDKPFSAHLRDVFAKVGICDSTQDLARRPALIDQLVSRAKQSPATSERLRGALKGVRLATLDRLLQEDIIIRLDERLSKIKTGFFGSGICATYYNTGTEKIIGLYDSGADGGGFFSARNSDNPPYALDEFVRDVLGKQSAAPLLLGKWETVGRTAVFRWHGEAARVGDITKNAWLATPPQPAAAPKPKGGDFHL